MRIRLGSNVELHMSRTQCKLGKSFCLSSFALSSADVKFDVCPGLYWPRLMYNIGLYREFKVYNLARARRELAERREIFLNVDFSSDTIF